MVRGLGSTRTLKGVVQKESDGAPLAGIALTVSGVDHLPFIYRLIPAPLSPTFQELRTVRTDATGHFSCTVPYYEHYHLRTSGPWAYWGSIEDEEKLTSSAIIIRAKEPNKAPEPTPGSVTPRASLPTPK